MELKLPSAALVAQSYTHLTQHIVPGPNSASYFIPFILIPAALCVPPSILSHQQLYLVFIPLIWACELHAWSQMRGLDVISVTVILWSSYLLVFKDPRHSFEQLLPATKTPARPEFRADHKDDKSGEERTQAIEPKGIEETAYPQGIRERIPWVLTLIVSVRLANWKIGDASHDRFQPQSSVAWAICLRRVLLRVIISYFFLDISTSLTTQDPYFTNRIPLDSPLAASPFSVIPPFLLRPILLATQLYSLLTLSFLLSALIPLFLSHLSLISDQWSPHTWPPVFGPLSSLASRGLRGFWGTHWHSMNRAMSSQPGRSLSQAMGINASSLLGYMLVTISAFGFSGVMHMGLIPPQPKSLNMTAMQMRLYMAGFFWAQIPGFGVEHVVGRIVSRFAKGWRPDWVTKALVVLWTTSYLCATLMLLVPPFRELGYWKVSPVPLSLVQWARGKGWISFGLLPAS